MGHKSITECKQNITRQEFAYWYAYNQISPIDGTRDDYLISLVAGLYALTANVNRDPQKGSPIKSENLLPEWLKPEKPESRGFDWRAHKRTMEALYGKAPGINEA